MDSSQASFETLKFKYGPQVNAVKSILEESDEGKRIKNMKLYTQVHRLLQTPLGLKDFNAPKRRINISMQRPTLIVGTGDTPDATIRRWFDRRSWSTPKPSGMAVLTGFVIGGLFVWLGAELNKRYLCK